MITDLASCFRIISLRIALANDDAFFKLMPRNLSRQSLQERITWRDSREWLNGVPRDGEKNDGDHYMLMLGHTPYDDYAAFQRAPRVAREKDILRYQCNSRVVRQPSSLFKLSAEIILFLRPPTCRNTCLVDDKARSSWHPITKHDS